MPKQDTEQTCNHEHHSSHQHAGMQNSPSMNARAECRMDMNTMNTTSITNIPKYTTHPLSVRAGCRMDMSTIPVINMPECTTNQLSVPEQNTKWTCNHKHHSSHQHARMHNSPTTSNRAGCKMDMRLSALFQSPTEYATHLLWVPDQHAE